MGVRVVVVWWWVGGGMVCVWELYVWVYLGFALVVAGCMGFGVIVVILKQISTTIAIVSGRGCPRQNGPPIHYVKFVKKMGTLSQQQKFII